MLTRTNRPLPDCPDWIKESSQRVVRKLVAPYQEELDSGDPGRQLLALVAVLEAIDNSIGSKMLDACTGEGLLRN
jgi:hypothetical protein